MKKLLLVAVCAILSINVNAQAFEQGSSVLSVGYGFPNLIKSIWKSYETLGGFKASGVGPAHLKFEYFVSDKISLGISAGYVSSKIAYDETYTNSNNEEVSGETGFKTLSVGALAKFNFYWLRKDKVMMYSGLGAGYNHFNISWFSDDPDFDELNELSLTLPPIGFEATLIGAKFMFSNNLGAFAEIGYGKSLLQAGLCFGFGGGGGRF